VNGAPIGQPASLAQQLGVYLSAHWKEAVEIENLSRIPGGASRQTYRFDAMTNGRRRGLILRRDPVDSLIDTDRRIEYLAYKSFHPLGVPTPEPLVLDEAGGVLERPFFLMSRIDGGKAASPFSLAPYAPHEAAIGEQFFSILGRIAATDPIPLPISKVAETPALDQCWSRELDHWERELDKDELHPHPIGRAAIRRLRRRPPPPAQKLSVVHGDYRSGNFMHDGEGRILAILDWEMAHLGDPLEDLAWAIDPLWSHFDDGRVSGLLPRAEAIAVWERASGLRIDPEALGWWELFNSLKGLVIWVSAAKSFRDGGGIDPVLGFTGLYCTRRHDQILVEKLDALLETPS
jgi:aminoglycoside phosphotransferase (APT) family kinase protein